MLSNEQHLELQTGWLLDQFQGMGEGLIVMEGTVPQCSAEMHAQLA